MSLAGQQSDEASKPELRMMQEFISSAEQEGYQLVHKKKCDRPSGEMCQLPFEITPDMDALDIVVIGNKKCKPGLAVKNTQENSVLAFTHEYEVTTTDNASFVRKTFNLKDSHIQVALHFGNTRSFAPADTYMLVFKK